MTPSQSLADAFVPSRIQKPGEGPLNMFLCNRTDIGRIQGSKSSGIATQPTVLSYPDREQPKPWTPKQWRAAPARQVLPYASPLHDGSTTRWTRMSTLAGIVDRGEKQVELGKRYRFVTQTTVGVRLAFELLGVAGGSTLRPGFEVFDLPERPGAWTQVWAQDFVDEWSVRISNPYFESWAQLSVELVPFPKRFRNFPLQRLIFTLEGHGSPFLPGASEEDDQTLLPEGSSEVIGPCQVRAEAGSFSLDEG